MRFFILIFILTIISCRQTAKIPEDFDYGKTGNGIYKNDYFDFEIPVPDSWHVQNKEQIDQIRKKGSDMIAESNRGLAEKIKASDVGSAILLAAYKNSTDSINEEYNPSFSIMAENLGSMSGVKKGKEYLINVKKLMQKSGMTFSFPSGFYSQKVGNKEFDAMDVIMNINGLECEQTYYSIVDKNFALGIIVSSVGKEQKETLKDIINKIKFK